MLVIIVQSVQEKNQQSVFLSRFYIYKSVIILFWIKAYNQNNNFSKQKDWFHYISNCVDNITEKIKQGFSKCLTHFLLTKLIIQVIFNSIFYDIDRGEIVQYWQLNKMKFVILKSKYNLFIFQFKYQLLMREFLSRNSLN